MNTVEIEKEKRLFLIIQGIIILSLIIIALVFGTAGDGASSSGRIKPICGNGIIEPHEKNCCQDLGCPAGTYCLTKDNETYSCEEGEKVDNAAYKDFKRLATTLVNSVYTTDSPEAIFSKNQINTRLQELTGAGYDISVEQKAYTTIIEHLETITQANEINKDITTYLSNEEVSNVYFNGADAENVSKEINSMKELADEAISLITIQEVKLSLLNEEEKALLKELGFNVDDEIEGYGILKQGFKDINKQLE